MKSFKNLFIGCAVLLLTCSIALADGHDKDKHSKDGDDDKSSEHKDHDKDRDKDHERGRDRNFTVTERQIIQDHYSVYDGKGKKGKKLPPGLAKKAARGEKLPPGWEKKLVRGETVPPEVFKQCEPLPQEVVVKLPAPPAGTISVVINGKAARLVEATHEILDVFDLLPKPPKP